MWGLNKFNLGLWWGLQPISPVRYEERFLAIQYIVP
jgi:hypothetical protein